MPRDFEEVINKVLTFIPEDQTELILFFQDLLEDYPSTFPDFRYTLWQRAGKAIRLSFPNPTIQWQIDVKKYFYQ